MNIALLDLLSCGLAVVVILLIVSLNTGSGRKDEVDQAVLVEIISYGAVALPDQYLLKSREGSDTIRTVPMPGGGNQILQLAIPPKLDTVLGIGSIISEEVQQYVLRGKNRPGVKQEFTFPRKAKGTRLSFLLDPYGVRNEFHLGVKIINKTDKVFERTTEKALDQPVTVDIRYEDRTHVTVRSIKDSTMLFSHHR